MYTETAALSTYFLPDDATAVDQALAAFLASAKTSIRFSLYGATHPLLFAGLISAYQRGVRVSGLFDHTEASTPTEAAQLHKLCLIIPPTSFRVGTSPDAHQILHTKCIVVDHAQVWSGSWNPSNSADKQFNNVDVIPSAQRAAAFEAKIAELWDWITAHEAGYQAMLEPAA